MTKVITSQCERNESHNCSVKIWTSLPFDVPQGDTSFVHEIKYIFLLSCQFHSAYRYRCCSIGYLTIPSFQDPDAFWHDVSNVQNSGQKVFRKRHSKWRDITWSRQAPPWLKRTSISWWISLQRTSEEDQESTTDGISIQVVMARGRILKMQTILLSTLSYY